MQNEFLTNDEDSALKAYLVSKRFHLNYNELMRERLCAPPPPPEVKPMKKVEGEEPFEPPE